MTWYLAVALLVVVAVACAAGGYLAFRKRRWLLMGLAILVFVIFAYNVVFVVPGPSTVELGAPATPTSLPGEPIGK